MSKDYYNILGVGKNALQDEIKKAFREKAHKYHPDKPGGDEAKFKELYIAFRVLYDSAKRSQYDSLKRQTYTQPKASLKSSSDSNFRDFDDFGISIDGLEDILNDFNKLFDL